MKRILKEIEQDRKHKARQIRKLEEERESLEIRLEAIESDYLPAERQLLEEYDQLIHMIKEDKQ